MSKTKPRQTDFTSRYPPRPPAGPPEVVDPMWIVKALGISLATAILLAYLAVCLLLYQGSWQLMLHPSARVARTPASAGLPYQDVRFDSADSGRPRLSAWWISGREPLTILYLHGASGSLGDTVDALAQLHQTGANLFAIDYRGFGASDAPHPSEERMTEDTRAALDYLTNTRHISSAAIVPYGTGLGASLAAELAAGHPELPAVVIDTPDLQAEPRAFASQKSRLLPMRLLLRDRFDLAGALAGMTQPKLLLAHSPDEATNMADEVFFRDVAAPKLAVSLGAAIRDEAYVESLQRFFDEYLPPQDLMPDTALPNPAPAVTKNP